MFCGDCGRVPGGCPGSRVDGPRPRDRTPSRTRPHVWCHTRVTRHVRGTVRAGVRGYTYSIHTADTCGALSHKWGVRSRGNGRGSVGSRPVFTVCLKPVRAREAVFRGRVRCCHAALRKLNYLARASLVSHETRLLCALWSPPSGLPSVGPCPAGPVRAVDAPRWGVGVRDPRLMKASAGSGGGS